MVTKEEIQLNHKKLLEEEKETEALKEKYNLQIVPEGQELVPSNALPIKPEEWNEVDKDEFRRRISSHIGEEFLEYFDGKKWRLFAKWKP